jgi:hypothetical protein
LRNWGTPVLISFVAAAQGVPVVHSGSMDVGDLSTVQPALSNSSLLASHRLSVADIRTRLLLMLADGECSVCWLQGSEWARRWFIMSERRILFFKVTKPPICSAQFLISSTLSPLLQTRQSILSSWCVWMDDIKIKKASCAVTLSKKRKSALWSNSDPCWSRFQDGKLQMHLSNGLETMVFKFENEASRPRRPRSHCATIPWHANLLWIAVSSGFTHALCLLWLQSMRDDFYERVDRLSKAMKVWIICFRNQLHLKLIRCCSVEFAEEGSFWCASSRVW